MPQYYDYDNKTFETGFQEFVKTIALSTTSIFSFNPSADQVKNKLAKLQNKPASSFKNITEDSADYRQGKAALIEEENEKPFIKK